MAQGSNAAQPQPPSRRESHSRDSQHQNRARDPRLARVRLQPPTQAPNGAQPQAWAQRDSSRDNRRRGGYSPSPLPRRESQPRHRDRSDESGAQPQALARRDSSRDNRQRGGYSPSPLPWRESQPRHRDRNDEPSEDHFLVPEATVGPLMGTGACNVVALSKQTGVNIIFQERGSKKMPGQPSNMRGVRLVGTPQGIETCRAHFSKRLQLKGFFLSSQPQHRPMVAVATEGQDKSALGHELPMQTQPYQVLLKRIAATETKETVLAALEQADPTLKTPPPGITAKPKGGVVDKLQLMPAASGYRTAYVRFADERARKHVLKHDWGGRWTVEIPRGKQ